MKAANSASVAPCSLMVFVAALAVSAGGPQTFLAWFSETFLIIAAASVFVITYRNFRFTHLTYLLFLAFALVVFEGARFTYALEPAGEWMRTTFGLARNHFDRIGHLMQGAAPAFVMRELLIRRASFKRGTALFWMVCGLCLGMAAMFELLEWQYAVTKGHDDLGAQGDSWDAQADMLMALIGAVGSQLLFSRLHDRQLADERSIELLHRVHTEQLQRSHHIAS